MKHELKIRLKDNLISYEKMQMENRVIEIKTDFIIL